MIHHGLTQKSHLETLQVASHFHFVGEGDNNILKILHSKIHLEQCIEDYVWPANVSI